MRKLYITHCPAELAMALIQFECAIAGAYLTSIAQHPVLVFVLAQLSVGAAGLCWVFLFTMPGSDKRREAAEASAEVQSLYAAVQSAQVKKEG